MRIIGLGLEDYGTVLRQLLALVGIPDVRGDG